jgi:hypothetical protein
MKLEEFIEFKQAWKDFDILIIGNQTVYTFQSQPKHHFFIFFKTYLIFEFTFIDFESKVNC